MSKFLTGKKLGDSVYDLVYRAKEFIIIISPYIKLDDYLRRLFEKHIGNQQFSIMLVFGKNSTSINKSMKREDMEFFKSFPNISIIYVENLHAKYYANERYEILTSLNLHEYSLEHNVEFGIKLFAHNLRKTNTVDADAWNNYLKIVKSNPAIYIKNPIVRKKNLIKWAVVGSEVVYDVTEDLYQNKPIPMKTINDFKRYINQKEKFPRKRPDKEELDELIHELDEENLVGDLGSIINTPLEEQESPVEELNDSDDGNVGSCINCGISISLKPKEPLCLKCAHLKESGVIVTTSFCHICGKPHSKSLDKPAHLYCYRKTKYKLEY